MISNNEVLVNQSLIVPIDTVGTNSETGVVSIHSEILHFNVEKDIFYTITAEYIVTLTDYIEHRCPEKYP